MVRIRAPVALQEMEPVPTCGAAGVRAGVGGWVCVGGGGGHVLQLLPVRDGWKGRGRGGS